MNHKWENNVCVNCGVHRMMQDYRKLERTYSKLIHGIWEDIPVYSYGKKWYYGYPNSDKKEYIKGIGFNRPDCKAKELNLI